MEKDKDKRTKLGELLVQYEVITSNMLKNALQRQSQVGGRIGSILIEMGYITTDVLADFLSRQLGVPSIDLSKVNIPPRVLQLLPLEKIKEFKALPITADEKYTIAMVNPRDHIAIQNIEFRLGKSVEAVVVPSSQMEAAIKSLEAGATELKGVDIAKCFVLVSDEEASDIKQLLKILVEAQAADLQLTAGVPASLKVSTTLRRLNTPSLNPEQMRTYALALMNKEQQALFETASDLDFAFTDWQYGRFRVNIYRQRNSVSITIRRVPERIPSMAELGLPSDLDNFALKNQGLILLTGPAGHGKSTTMASMVDVINNRRKCNIITLEDPIEYLHKHKNSNVNQREIGIDTSSFHEGLKHIFRQSPDVIVIGEMRDPASFEIALHAAETGHLVLSTLHSRNATSTIERVIDMFPPHAQPQIRTQLADCLLLILSQRLVLKKGSDMPVLACERLVNSWKIKNFIRESKTHQIRSQLQRSAEDFTSIDVSLARLCIEGRITEEEGTKHADNVAYFHEMVKEKKA